MMDLKILTRVTRVTRVTMDELEDGFSWVIEGD